MDFPRWGGLRSCSDTWSCIVEMSEEEESSQEVSQEKPVEKQPQVECPTPPEHVQAYQDACEKYSKGEMTDLEVMGKVIDDLRKLRQTKE